jgi:hypothetical protein
MSNAQPAPSPAPFFAAVNAYQRTVAVEAAVELDLFTAIAEGRRTVQELSERCAASERGIRILCDYLVVIEFLTKENQRYGLTPDAAAFLDRRSPGYMGGAIEFLLSPMLTDGFRDLATAVRRGGTVLSGQGVMEPDHPVWVKFARAMMPMMALPARQLPDLVPCDPGRELRVLDLAAGHGLFGIAFAQRYPRAEIVALDWPNVLEVARENAQGAGVGDRYRLLPGSAFEVDYGSGYDLVLLTNFLHHFDVPTNEALLKKVHAALGESGRAVTLEFVPNEDRVSPPEAASFSLMMLGATRSGDAYTFSELDAMFRSAGFSRSELRALEPGIERVVVSFR